MRTFFYCLAGSLLVAFSMNQFITPLNLAPGGITGIAVILFRLTKGFVSVGAGIFILNVPLFWAGYKRLGKNFVLRSLLGTVLCSVMIDALSFTSSYWTMPLDEPLLVCLAGGLLLGVGYGLIFRCGASTGGTDILARLVQPRASGLSLGQLCLLFDVVFLGIVFLYYRSVTSILYIGVTVFVSSKMIDWVEGGLDYAKEVFVVSPQIALIGEAVTQKLGRGCTRIRGEGFYSGESRDVLWCVVYNRQLSTLREIVQELDPAAFVAIRNVREVNGLFR